MAVVLSPDIQAKRGRDSIKISPRNLIVDPKKRGREFPPSPEKVRELANDIKANGQRQTVTFGKTADKKLELIAGFTRWEALMLLDSEEPDKGWVLEGFVFEGNAEEQFVANINENRIRNYTSAIDDAHNIRRLSRDFGKTDEEIRSIYGGKSQAWLDHTIRPLLDLSREQQKAIHEGQLSASAGLLLAKMAPEVREALVEEAAKTGKVTTTEVLKAARKSGNLTKTTSLKMSEVKTAHTYLLDSDSPKLKKFAKTYLEYTAGELPEPDYFKALKRLLGE